MILDLARFIEREKPLWGELERMLERVTREPGLRLSLGEVLRLQYLYERTSADLARISGMVTEHEVRNYLEALVARAYGEIHETRSASMRFRPLRWLLHDFPATFRAHIRYFWAALAITLAGMLFGGFALAFDHEAKEVLLPFWHLQGNPSDRVAEEEAQVNDEIRDTKARFSGQLMTHNIQVSLFVMALGLTWGLGTIVLLFYNGVILGAVITDYVLAGESAFLAGWLLPHGSVEIPSIIIAGQAGLLLARALIGYGKRNSVRDRLRAILPALLTLVGGLSVMLVWAGVVEAFLSQYHEPVIPYAVKILLGIVELVLLGWFLSRFGREGRAA